MKRRKPGEAQAYLRGLVGHHGDACVHWPYKLNTSGYGYVYVGGRYVTAPRFLCGLAHGEPSERTLEAAHSCGVRDCVNPNHLRWATKAENAADKRTQGTAQRGERATRVTLTEADARAILASDERTRVLAERYGVSERQIRRIQTGAQWSHLRWSDNYRAEAA